MTEKRTKRGHKVKSQSQIIGNFLIEAKLPPNPMGRVSHIPYPLINQIGQPASISDSQVDESLLITKAQRTICANSTHKGPRNWILTSKTPPKVPTSPQRGTHLLMKKLHHWITNGLQPNPTITHEKLIHKIATKISNRFRALLKFGFCKIDKFAIKQVLETTLLKKILQNNFMHRRSNNMARTPFTLIILWNIQLNIQVA